jgi:hypothetical protein
VQSPDDDGTAVGRVAFARYPTAAFESIEDSSHGSRVEAGAARERTWAQRTVAIYEVEEVEVDIV